MGCKKQSVFPKNAWVDNEVMTQITERFIKHKVKVHRADVWVLLLYINLRAHVADQVQKIFDDTKMILYFLPKNISEMVQPINAGLGRPLRCKIWHGLDTWVMSEDNLSKWEENMTAGERRVLITKLISDTQEEILKKEYDSQQVGCFERTGYPITKLATHEYD